MRLLLLADIGGNVSNLPTVDGLELDAVLIAGDITVGSKSMKNVTRFFENLGSVYPPPMKVFYIPGNHDVPAIATRGEWVPRNFEMLHGNVTWLTSCDEFTACIVGFGGAAIGLYNNFAFEENEILDSLDHLYSTIPENSQHNATVLLVHDPPRDTLVDLNMRGDHVGSKSVRDIIEQYRPELVVCGHIHEALGTDKIGPSLLVNPGEAKYGKYAIVVLEKGKAIQVEFFG